MSAPTRADDVSKNGRVIVIRELLKKVDFSKLDRNIDSVLDKQHVSRQEVELLKAQALVEALEENAYHLSEFDKDFFFPNGFPVKFKEVKSERKTFDQRLKALNVDNRLKNKLKDFAESLKKAIKNAGIAFQNFQESPEVKKLEEKISNAGEKAKTTAKSFVLSQEFKSLETKITHLFEKINNSINHFFKKEEEKSNTSKAEERSMK